MQRKNIFSVFLIFLSVIFLAACGDSPTTSVSPAQIAAAKKSAAATTKNKGALKFAAKGSKGSNGKHKANFKAMFEPTDMPPVAPVVECLENGDGTFTVQTNNPDGSTSSTIYLGNPPDGDCTLGPTPPPALGAGTSTPPTLNDPSNGIILSARTCLGTKQLAGALYTSSSNTAPGEHSEWVSMQTATYFAEWGYSDYASTTRESYCMSFNITATGASGRYTGTDFSDLGITLLATYDFTFEANGDSFTGTGTITYADKSVERWSISDSAKGTTLTITYLSDGSVLKIAIDPRTGNGTGIYSDASGNKIADVTITSNFNDGTISWKYDYVDGTSETYIE